MFACHRKTDTGQHFVADLYVKDGLPVFIGQVRGANVDPLGEPEGNDLAMINTIDDCADPGLARANADASKTAPAPASQLANEILTIDNASSTIAFVGAKVTGDHHGDFKEYSGNATVMGKTPASINFTIEMASVVADRMVARSFFLTQLERRGLHLSDGPQGYIAATMPVMHLMRHRGADDCASDTACWELVEQGAYLRRDDTLERALPMLERLRGGFLPVVDGTVSETTTPELLGTLFQTDALSAYTHALEDELREEHG